MDLGVGPGQVLAGARLEPDVAAGLACHAALAVEFALQEPVVTEVATVGQCRQHQREWHGDIIATPLEVRKASQAWVGLLPPSLRQLVRGLGRAWPRTPSGVRPGRLRAALADARRCLRRRHDTAGSSCNAGTRRRIGGESTGWPESARRST